MDGRAERERIFHDQVFSSNSREPTAKFYSVTARSRSFYLNRIVAPGANGCALEYGCGPGSAAFYLAERGATVTGIDISEVAVSMAREEAAKRGLQTSARFTVMNAEALAFPDDSFDLICGTGILHHLDLARAFGEIRRTLKPDGKAVFMEPLAHNPLIQLYRMATPGMRTVDEHPLRMSDLRMAHTFFDGVQARFFHLQSLAAVAFRNLPFFQRLVSGLEALDEALFRTLSVTRRFAWRVVLVISRPRKGIRSPPIDRSAPWFRGGRTSEARSPGR